MALAPSTVQNIPERFSRAPMTVLHAASMTPEPTNRSVRSEAGIAHPVGVSFKVLGFVGDELCDVGAGRTKFAQIIHKRLNSALLELLQSPRQPPLATAVVPCKQAC